MSADEKIVADYERAVAAGAVRVGERAPGRLAVLVVALDLGLTSSVPVSEALRRAGHPDQARFDGMRDLAKAKAGACRGRPRKDGPRTESDRLSRAKSPAAIAAAYAATQAREDERADARTPRPAELARMRELLRQRAGEKPTAWLTAAGMDFLAGRLTETLFAEATEIFETRADHLSALGVSSSARSVDLEPGHRGEGVDVDSEAGDKEARRHRAAVERGEALLDAIERQALTIADPAEASRRRYALASEARASVLRYCCEASATDVDRERTKLVLAGMISERREVHRMAARTKRRMR